MFDSIEHVAGRLRAQRYIASREITTTVYLAGRLEKPLLVEGPAGVGKTELGKALPAALVKRVADRPTFDALFDLHFGVGGTGDEEWGDGAVADAVLSRAVGEPASPAETLAQALLTGNAARLAALIAAAGQAVGVGGIAQPHQVAGYARRIMRQFDWAAVKAATADALEALAASLSAEELAGVQEQAQANARAFWEAVNRHVQRELERRRFGRQQAAAEATLADRPLADLDGREIEQIRALVRQLARRLRERIALRRKRARRGKLDFKRTLRRNLQYGGLPVDLAFRRRRPNKSQAVTLCDVSSSVAYVSRFMLEFVYCVQEGFSKVRSYLFIDDVVEVTDCFAHYAVDQAVSAAMERVPFSRSDYGWAFTEFAQYELEAITPDTTVIIIGDARSNNRPPETWALQAIAERAKRVIWLNPEPPQLWDTGDSIMGHYWPYCTAVRQCRTLRQLTEVVEELVS